MKSFILLLLLVSNIASAQKNAPVAGHAARLVDLLKKDYNATDIALRTETINKDMEEVIATLMVYADEDAKTNLASAAVLNPNTLSAYQDAIYAYNNFNKASQGVTFSNSTLGQNPGFTALNDASTILTKTKTDFDNQKYIHNITALYAIRNHFEITNSYLSHITYLFIQKFNNAKSLNFDNFAETNYTSSIQKASPFFGGDLAFSEAIDGLSRFLAQRIKDELTTYAVEKIQDYLNNPKPESYLNELMVLLPTTTSYLKTFDASRTLNFVDDLKQYIEDDLNNLIANAANLKNTPRFKKYIADHPDLDFAFEALEILPQISKLENPIDYFDMLENSRSIQRWASSYEEGKIQVTALPDAIKIYYEYTNEADPIVKALLKGKLDIIIKQLKIYDDNKIYINSFKDLTEKYRTTEINGYLNAADNKIVDLNEAFTLNKLYKLRIIKSQSLDIEEILDPGFITKLDNAIVELDLKMWKINSEKAKIFNGISLLDKEEIDSRANNVYELLKNILINYKAGNLNELYKNIESLSLVDMVNIPTKSKTGAKIIIDRFIEIRNIQFPELKVFINNSTYRDTGYNTFSPNYDFTAGFTYEALFNKEMELIKSKLETSDDKKFKDAATAVFTHYETLNPGLLKTAIENYKKINTAKPPIQYNIANTIKLASMLAHSLMIVEDSKPKFANTAFMSAYSSEVNFYLLYIGFLQQQNKKYYNVGYHLQNRYKQLDFSGLMANFPAIKVTQKAAEFKVVSGSLIKIASNAEKLHNSLLDIKKANAAGEKITAEQVHSLTADVIDFSEDVLFTADTLVANSSLKLLGDFDVKPLIHKTTPYITTARTVNDIFLDLHTKNYTTAIIKAIEIPSAFGKSNDQFSFYSEMLTITNNLNSVQQLQNLKKLFEYPRLYTNTEKLENQKELARWILVSLQSNPKLSGFITYFDPVYNLIDSGKDHDAKFSSLMTQLKKNLLTSNFYSKYAEIDVTSLKDKVGNYLLKKGVTITVKDEIIKSVDSILNNSVNYYLTNDIALKEKLEDDKKLLITNLKFYLPEMFPDIFQFKDENTVKLIHFVNDVANSDSAEDVEKALNTFALPPGSSSLKEKTRSYYSVNAYPGLYGGFTTASLEKGDSYTAGFTAPIGIYAQLASGRSVTWGLFMPVIDIAAPVRLRLGDNTEQLPDLEFKDIFSPGLFLSIGFKGPFAVNVGVQYGPSLRGFTENENDPALKNAIEEQTFYFSTALTLDIPLFTIHAHSKN
ncbi:hypothetical protein [Flavobacterium cheongpyeongense]|nr:hypothetical protein [Flavobacterium cheongpyeongense]